MENKNKGLRGEQLAQLYFKAKTSDERREDERRLEEIQLARRPRRAHLRTAFFGSLILFLVGLLFSNISSLWSSGNLTTISFTFLVWLALGYGMISWFNFVRNVYYAYEQSSTVFLFVYFGLSMILLAAWVNGWLSSYPAVLVAGLVTLTHFLAGYILSRILLSTR